jgi:predicted RNase H-like HicB family nuclease
MHLTVELDRELDGRWIAEVVDLPGVLIYGSTREKALVAAQALALWVLADKLRYGETSLPLALSFDVTAARAPGPPRRRGSLTRIS